MNSNFQKTSIEMKKTSQISSISHNTHRPDIVPNPQSQISPMNRVAILKTEEQKEIVRTNVFEPNNTSSGNDQKFCVVTEVIKRKSNIPLDSKVNSSNKEDMSFSFNKPISDPALNQISQNKTLNIHIADSKIKEKIKNQESYKLLIKRIASQLAKRIRPPTHGFFFFALQKGQYPFIIIKKLESRIVDHSIDLNSDIFRVYTEKYIRYRELVKKIAFLLKQHMNNKMFWESERYKNQSIQVKVTNKTSSNNNLNANAKNNIHSHNSTITLKKNNNIKSNQQNQQNKKVANVKNPQMNQINNQKKIKTHTMKTNTNINITKNNMSHPSTSQNNYGSNRLNNVVNPFNAAKNQNQKKTNLTKKVEPINKNNLFNKSIKNKNMNNKNEEKRSASSETNKSGKNKLMNIPKIPNFPIKDSNMIKEEGIPTEKTQIINISKKVVNNNNMVNIQNASDVNRDIEMKDESEKINQEKNNNEQKTFLNMKIIPHRNTTSIMNASNLNDSNMNNVLNNSSIIRQNNVKKITFDSIKSPGKKLEIKLSTFKKSEDILNANINQIILKNQPKISSPLKEINLNTIDVPLYDNKITDEHISFVNKFSVFMSSNGINMEYNIPMAKNVNGINYLKKSEFWEKYIHYIYMDYLVNKKNKLSLFTFIHLMEQYFLWCEYLDSETSKRFKKLIIDMIKKIFSKNEIDQFLLMYKMNDLEQLFAKYEIFMKYGKNNNYKTNKEIEIKLDVANCNCDLCQNEKACIKKISELNKKTNTNVNIENILIEAQYSPKAKKKENENSQLEINNNFISFSGKDKSGLFSKSKTLHSFESVYQYIPPQINIISEEKKKSSTKRKKSKSKSKENSKKEEKKEKENFIDLTSNKKIDEFLVSKEEEEKEDNEEKEELNKSNNRSRSKKKNSKRNNKKNKKRNSNVGKYETDSESEEEKEREKEKKKDKNKKKQRNKSRNKSYSRKYPESDSESYSEDSDYGKNKNKKSRDYPRRKKGKSKW